MMLWSDNDFMPLTLKPEGLMEEDGHRVLDAEGVYLCRIVGDMDRAERFIRAANSHDALVKALQEIADPLSLKVDGIGFARTLALITRMSSIAKDTLANLGPIPTQSSGEV